VLPANYTVPASTS